MASVLTLAVLVSCPFGAALAEDTPALTVEAKSIDIGGATLDLVKIPAGTFQMGAPKGETEADKNERPQHEVKLTEPFWMGRTEITNKQFRCFRAEHHSGAQGCALDGDDQPAVYISWYDAVAFCQWLSKKTGEHVRLPTEAEWEYACRAGTTTRFYSGNNGGKKNKKTSPDLHRVAWYSPNAKGRSHPVGQKPANAFGLHDMHGNAWEWCWDWYGGDYYASLPVENPMGPKEGVARVMRGGSYVYYLIYPCRSAHRYRLRPDWREKMAGFRVVISTIKVPNVAIPPEKPTVIVPLYDEPETEAEKKVARQFGLPVTIATNPKTPPKIDGILDDACWRTARKLPFRHLSARPTAPGQATTAWILADSKKLYVAFDCAEAEMDKLRSAGKARDDAIWRGDCVELFIDPQHKEAVGQYAQLTISPKGLTLDTRNGDKKWNPAIELKTSRYDTGWRVELALPHTELGLTSNALPKLWGLNLTRFRPSIATESPVGSSLVPHSWMVDEPDRLRFAEDTAWSPTFADSSHIPARFGHVIIEAGTKETPAPASGFQVVKSEDFSKGELGHFTHGEIVDGGYMGIGKALHVVNGKATCFKGPFKDLKDLSVIAVVKMQPPTNLYWHCFGKMMGSNKICFRKMDSLTRNFLNLPPSVNYCKGAGRIDVTSRGTADPYYAGFKKYSTYFSEPVIGVYNGWGKHWSVLHTRLGFLQTQHPHNKRPDPDKEELNGIFFHGGKDLWISSMVVFRGTDLEAPEKVKNVTATRKGGQLELKWGPSTDNTLTIWYRVSAEGGEIMAEVPALTASIPLEKAKGKILRVQAVDYYENFSVPSDPVSVSAKGQITASR